MREDLRGIHGSTEVRGEDVLLTAVDTKSIGDLKERLVSDGLAAASVNKYLANLKAILYQAKDEWGVLNSTPKIKMLKLQNDRLRWLTVEEEQKLLAECEQTPHLKNLVTFLIDTGVRLSEATYLTWADVDLDRQPRGIVRLYPPQ